MDWMNELHENMLSQANIIILTLRTTIPARNMQNILTRVKLRLTQPNRAYSDGRWLE